MPHRQSTQKMVSVTLAAIAGAVMCGLFAMVLFAAGALAA